MSIGLGIFLFVVGAILTFALNISVDAVNLDLVGGILMIAGALIAVLGVVLLTKKRSSVTTMRSSVDPESGEQITRREHKVDDIEV